MKRIELRRTAGRCVLGGLVAVGAAASVAGCGGSSSGTRHTSDLVLARAVDTSSAAPGYKLAMTMHETVADTNVDLKAYGSVSPATHAATMTMLMSGASTGGLGALQMKLVLAKGAIYVKLPQTLASRIPGGKPWISVSFAQMSKVAHLPGYGTLINSSSSFTNPGQYLDFLRATANGTVKNLGQATVNGVPTTHYHAEIDLAKLPNAVPSADKSAVRQLVATLQKRAHVPQLPIDAWIDHSHLIRRLQIVYTMTLTTGQTAQAAITENIRSYGPQPAPVVPSSGQTTNLLSLMSGSATNT